MEPQSNSKKPLELMFASAIFLLVVLVLIFVAKRIWTSTSYSEIVPTQTNEAGESANSGKTAATQPSPQAPTTHGDGAISVETKDGKVTYAVGELIALVVKAKATEAIVGYDVVLPMDGHMVALVSKRSVSPDFQFIGTLNKTTLSVTGSKKLSVKVPIYLKDTPLFELVLKPVAKGTITLKPVYIKPGQTDDSNLINGDADDVLQETVGLTVIVQ